MIEGTAFSCVFASCDFVDRALVAALSHDPRSHSKKEKAENARIQVAKVKHSVKFSDATKGTETMKNISAQTLSRRLLRTLGVAAIVMSAMAHGLVGFTTQAAVRLPEEAISVEPWMIPSVSIPPLVDPVPARDLIPPEASKRWNADPQKTLPERPRRSNKSRRDKRALTELLGLVGSRDEPAFMRSFESFQSCREYVAINC